MSHEGQKNLNRRHSNYFSEMKKNLAQDFIEAHAIKRKLCLKKWNFDESISNFSVFFASSQFYCPSKDTTATANSLKFHNLFLCCLVMKWKENCSVDVKRRKLNENFLEEKSFRKVFDDMKIQKWVVKISRIWIRKYLIHRIK